MNILNETNSSNNLSSYDSKLRYLKSIIDKRNKLINQIDKELIQGTFLGVLGTGSVTYEINNLININTNDIPLSINELLIECLISFTSIALLFYSADKFDNCIERSKDIKSYNNYIYEYKRRLK